MLVQAFLGGVEDLQDAQAFPAIGDRRLALVAALNKVGAFQAERFLFGNINQFSAGFLGLGDLPARPDQGLAVKDEFFFPREGVIEN